MQTIAPGRLAALAQALLESAGVPGEEAEIVAWHCVDANLAGHDSHGIIRIPDYLRRLEQGHITPRATLGVLSETATTLALDGRWGLGQVVMTKAIERLVAKARVANVAAATVINQGHVGRLSAYALQAAAEGMIALVAANSGRVAKKVAPFGGAEGRLATNPIALAVPSSLAGPFHIDMATSATAFGKVKVATARGESLPEGVVLDHDGIPTTDPKSLERGGVILPFGGRDGFKATGLGAMVEVLCSLLTGVGYTLEGDTRTGDCCFVALFNVVAFRPLETFRNEVTEFAQVLRSTRVATGFDRVRYPGERSHEERMRRADGVLVEELTMATLIELARARLPEREVHI